MLVELFAVDAIIKETAQGKNRSTRHRMVYRKLKHCYRAPGRITTPTA
jgi:stress-induced morphogen